MFCSQHKVGFPGRHKQTSRHQGKDCLKLQTSGKGSTSGKLLGCINILFSLGATACRLVKCVGGLTGNSLYLLISKRKDKMYKANKVVNLFLSGFRGIIW